MEKIRSTVYSKVQNTVTSNKCCCLFNVRYIVRHLHEATDFLS